MALGWFGLKWRGSRMGDGQRKGVVMVGQSLVEEEWRHECREHMQNSIESRKKQRRKRRFLPNLFKQMAAQIFVVLRNVFLVKNDEECS